MLSGGHGCKGTNYGTDGVQAYAAHGRRGVLGKAFFDPALKQSLKYLVPGKRVVDVGCGTGDWCYPAAQFGAVTVDGFDIQEDMVNLAKQTTSHLDMVRIQVGNAADMPYDDASFDLALSILVTCNLPLDSFTRHFHELYRVLVPGGKAIMVVPTDWSHTTLYTTIETNSSEFESELTEKLKDIPKYPTSAQVTKAFKNTNEIIMACFTIDDKGELFRIKMKSQVADGHPIWRKTDVMTFPNFFYCEQYVVETILAAGLHINKVKDCFTKERLMAYNKYNPVIRLSEDSMKHPNVLIYHVSKPFD